MSDWIVAFHQLKIEDKADAQIFLEALDQIYQHSQFSFLLNPVTVPDLYTLFGKRLAEQTPLSLAICQNKAYLLIEFFQSLDRTGLSFPGGSVAAKCFIRLCCLDMPTGYLERMLSIGLLNYLPVDQLQRLELSPFVSVEAIIDFFFKYQEALPPCDIALGIEMLLSAKAYMVKNDAVDQLYQFLLYILPCYVERFSDSLGKATLYTHSERIVSWWMVWKRYHNKEEKDLPLDDLYYQMKFPDIIRFVPACIWWNNGMSYYRGKKYYHFESVEFRHLAVGGSIRKGPDPRPYTRRMARAFVNLPALFDTSARDMYLYLYGQSLDAGPLLLEVIPEFVRHYDDVEALAIELARWNPIIQKLACPEFEALLIDRARELMGYLYHCLRDRRDFSVSRRSVENLFNDTERYLARITARAQERRDRLNRREAARKARMLAAKKISHWNTHPRIQPMEFYVKGDKYKITELTNEQMLIHEGKVMKHCVGSYISKCFMGRCSIWSLREFKEGSWRSLVTIEIQKNSIVQASAVCNAVPGDKYRGFINSWARRERILYNY